MQPVAAAIASPLAIQSVTQSDGSSEKVVGPKRIAVAIRAKKICFIDKLLLLIVFS
jgi:hypothetical protein